MATPTNKQLREFILASFNENELYTFCFDYFEGVEHNFSDNMPMLKKVIELISYCNRHQITENLLVALEEERPQTYRAAFAAQQPERRTRARAYQPQPRNPQQIFVSHASEDTDLAHQIARDLETNGYDIFITPNSIHPGEKWVPAINRGLEESGIFVILLTLHAVQSYWVHEETNTAIALANAGEARLFILDVQDCHPPILWRQRQFVSFRSSDYQSNLHNLLNGLKGEMVRPQRKPQPSPARKKETPPRLESVKQPKLEKNSFIHDKTGLEFVRIPAGEFTYSYKAVEKKKPLGGTKTEYEERKIHLPEFWISKAPVTQAVYQPFDATYPRQYPPYAKSDLAKRYYRSKNKRTYPPEKAEHPVVRVSWVDAVAFCEWAGLELPTEGQWEKAARGTDGWIYPWGDNEPTYKLCNFNNTVGGTTPVGHYSPQGDSPYGCVDMSGNVWEWCLNKYDKPEDTDIDESNAMRVLRGGSWNDNLALVCVVSRYHGLPDNPQSDYGFRVVARRPPLQ